VRDVDVIHSVPGLLRQQRSMAALRLPRGFMVFKFNGCTSHCARCPERGSGVIPWARVLDERPHSGGDSRRVLPLGADLLARTILKMTIRCRRRTCRPRSSPAVSSINQAWSRARYRRPRANRLTYAPPAGRAMSGTRCSRCHAARSTTIGRPPCAHGRLTQPRDGERDLTQGVRGGVSIMDLYLSRFI